jgi:uncharacterized protein (TIGR03435 family)
MSRKIVYASLVTVLACHAFGQGPAFDAVSIKPNLSGDGGSSSNSHNGVFTGTNVSLKQLITSAYRMLPYQISGPEWLASQKFDVAAKPPSGTKDEDLPFMMRAMLEDRFKLAAHRDSKVFPVYGLVIAKGGARIKPVEDAGGHSTNSRNGTLKAERVSMTGLAAFLARQMDRPVVDMTELPGVFTFTLNWTPDDANSDKPAGTETYPPLLTALQEQLGLKLEPKKAPLEILVVDRIEKVPSEN